MDFLEAIDQSLLGNVYADRPSWLNGLMVFFTHLGGWLFLTIFTVVSAAGFLFARRPTSALLLVAVALVSTAFTDGFKELVRRPRPEAAPLLIDLPASYSFPSGHALSSAAIYGTLAFAPYGAAFLFSR